jgi:hypothetical protein
VPGNLPVCTTYPSHDAYLFLTPFKTTRRTNARDVSQPLKDLTDVALLVFTFRIGKLANCRLNTVTTPPFVRWRANRVFLKQLFAGQLSPRRKPLLLLTDAGGERKGFEGQSTS